MQVEGMCLIKKIIIMQLLEWL